MAAETHRIPHDTAIEKTVAEVMIAAPKTLPSATSVADVNAAFANTSVRIVVLADGGAFRGAIVRGAVPASAAGDEPALAYADTSPLSARPGMSMRDAVGLLDLCPEPRLVVLDDDATTLRGMLCLNRRENAFCTR